MTKVYIFMAVELMQEYNNSRSKKYITTLNGDVAKIYKINAQQHIDIGKVHKVQYISWEQPYCPALNILKSVNKSKKNRGTFENKFNSVTNTN